MTVDKTTNGPLLWRYLFICDGAVWTFAFSGYWTLTAFSLIPTAFHESDAVHAIFLSVSFGFWAAVGILGMIGSVYLFKWGWKRRRLEPESKCLESESKG